MFIKVTLVHDSNRSAPNVAVLEVDSVLMSLSKLMARPELKHIDLCFEHSHTLHIVETKQEMPLTIEERLKRLEEKTAGL